MNHRPVSLRALLPLLWLALAPLPAAAVARFDTTDVVLHASRSFNGTQGSPNPFVDVQLTADVISPTSRKYVVEGFFDGDGASGSSGDVFRLRLYADEVGTWRWATHSNDPGLDGKSGSFSVSGTLAGTFGKGPVTKDPTYPHSFRYQVGGPVFLAGKFLDTPAADPIKYSLTLLSEQLTDTDRRAMLDRHLGMQLNKMDVYLANKADYSIYPTTPWVGTAEANDKSRFDLARWRMFERWVRELRTAGMVAQLWFFADDSAFGSLPDADRERLVRYGMARLSGYVNTMFTLVLEWQEGWTADEVDHHMIYLQSKNPWRRLASVHGQIGDFSFPNASWADYLDVQAGSANGHATVHQRGLTNWALAAKPVIQEEFCRGEENTGNRQKTWAAFTAGAASVGSGAFLAPLVRFAARVPFYRMSPADSLIKSGTAYALAEPGQSYVFYFPYAGTITVDLTAAPGVLVQEWYRPDNGTYLPSTTVSGGGITSFKTPQTGDWVLYIHH